jgi:hypothetical protein
MFDILALKPSDGWDGNMYTFQKFLSNEGETWNN